MNILIVGEFSAFAKELKTGFVALGHQCIIFSWGDGAKKIKQTSDDYSCTYVSDKGRIVSVLSRIWMNIKLFFKVQKLSASWNADVVLVINTSFVRRSINIHHTGLTINQIMSLKSKEAKILLSACGGDYLFYKYNNLMSKYDLNSEKKKFDRVIKDIDFVIPTHYDYAWCYRQSPYCDKLLMTIPLPVNTSEFKPCNQIQNNEIVIFLGKMRPSKGYKSMNEALNIIVKKYPNIKRIPNQFLSINEYFIELSKANILIDQCTSYSYGMNALYALSMGKCVLSGNSLDGANEYGLTVQDIPIINIEDDIDMIVSSLEQLINNPQLIIEYSKSAREYVEKYHNSVIIAQKYLDHFKIIK